MQSKNLRRSLLVALLLRVTFKAGAQLPDPVPADDAIIRAPIEYTTVQGMEVRRDSYPIVDGSTSTQLLGHLLGSYMMGVPAELRRIGRAWGSVVVLTYPLEATDQQVDEMGKTLKNWGTHYGTHQSYEGLINGKADLILVAREPSPDEIQAAREKKVELDVQPIALDALVFLVNDKNPVTSLSLEQIRQIYTGNVTSWKDVGGENQDIRAFTRDRNSGSEELMTKLVMQERPIIRGGDRMMATMAGIIDGVAKNPDSLAYSVYYYAKIMNPADNSHLIGVNGVIPTSETIANRQYPLVEPTYAVIRKDAKADSAAVRWRDWLLSDEGQMLVAASGFMPAKAPASITDAPQPQPEAQPQ